MITLVRILIVSDNAIFVKRIESLIKHPQIIVDNSVIISKNIIYNFYVLNTPQAIENMHTIHKINEQSFIYLYGDICNMMVPVHKMIKCNIIDCLTDKNMTKFSNKVQSFYKQQLKLYEVSNKFDLLKSGDLKILSKEFNRVESKRFVDYVQNHPLPMVLISRDSKILHANVAMENLIGIKLTGVNAEYFWEYPEEFNKAQSDLRKEGHILGREVTFKNSTGQLIQMKLYTSLHYNTNDNWINTRCLLVPLDQIDPN